MYTFSSEGMINILCRFLRGSPDLSIASERCSQVSHLDVDGESSLTNRSHEQASLSQHHLNMMSAILEDASSCCSLSQHSLSPGSNYQATQIHDEEHSSGLENNEEWQKEGGEQINADLDRNGTACGLSSSIPVRSFQKLLETDPGVASSSAVAYSSVSVPSQPDGILRFADTAKCQIKNSTLVQKLDSTCTKEPQFRPSESREQPQGGSSFSSTQKSTTGRDSSRLSVISNITVRSTRRQTSNTTDLSLRQLQLLSDSLSSAPGGRNQTENKNTPIGQNVTPGSEGGVYMPGLQGALWRSNSQRAADGSFLPQPVFQSTPAVLLGKGAPAPARLCPVHSHQDSIAASTQSSSPKPDGIPALTLSTTSHQSFAGVTLATSLDPAETYREARLQHGVPHSQEVPSPRLDVSVVACEDTPLDQPKLPTTSDQQLKDQELRLSSGRVHSLPSLSYVQKVETWKANQSSNKSFYDNLSLQGFDGVPPKRKEQESVSEARIQQSQQNLNKASSVVSANTSTLPTQSGSGVLSSTDVGKAGEAVRSTSPSPFTHSHSHSSLGTIITPLQQEELQQNQLPLVCADAISPGFNSTAVDSSASSSGTNDQRPADDSRTGPSYSGVNLYTNMSNTVSSFPGGLHAEQSFQASLGASSVVSLEVDNYAPYWTSRPGSPPHPPDFNIEDRIPVSKNKLLIHRALINRYFNGDCREI